MKKTVLICLSFIMMGIAAAHAQGILDKVDRTLDKADRASNTSDRSSRTGNKIMGLFGKKKTATGEAESKTTVKFTGISFADLKSVNEKLQSAKGIQSTKMKFSSSGSSIVVNHTGTTDDVLKTLQKASPTVFNEKNIEGLDEGEIAVKVKQ